jgi:hypothetical protein
MSKTGLHTPCNDYAATSGILKVINGISCTQSDASTSMHKFPKAYQTNRQESIYDSSDATIEANGLTHLNSNFDLQRGYIHPVSFISDV